MNFKLPTYKEAADEGSRFDAHAFLNRPVPPQTEEVIKKSEGYFGHHDFDNPSAEWHWSWARCENLSSHKELKVGQDILRRAIQGEVVLDLGSSWNTCYIQGVAAKLKAKACFSIDKFHLETCLDNPEIMDGVPLYTVREDMLRFLTRLKDRSCGAITINNIDVCIIRTGEYQRVLADEMHRVLKHDGVVFNSNSEVSAYFKEAGFTNVWKHPERGSYIDQKPSELHHLSSYMKKVRSDLSCLQVGQVGQ